MIVRIAAVIVLGLIILGIFMWDDRSKFRKYIELQRRRRESEQASRRQEQEVKEDGNNKTT